MQFTTITLLAFAVLSAAAPAESLLERDAEVSNKMTVYSDNGCLNALRTVTLTTGQCANVPDGFASMKIDTHNGNGDINIYAEPNCAGTPGRKPSVKTTGCIKNFAFGAAHSLKLVSGS